MIIFVLLMLLACPLSLDARGGGHGRGSYDVFDKSSNRVGYVRDGNIYDKSWNRKGYIREDGSVFDTKSNRKGSIKEGR